VDEFGSPIAGRREKREAAWEMRRRPTEAGAMLWQALRGSRLSGLHFRREQVIDGYIVDFYCHTARLVVEVDGAVHDKQRDYDAARDEALAARGLHVLRVTNDEVLAALPSVLTRILTSAVQRSRQASRTYDSTQPIPNRGSPSL
jgi:very-short-patch-repair endonuclease